MRMITLMKKFLLSNVKTMKTICGIMVTIFTVLIFKIMIFFMAINTQLNHHGFDLLFIIAMMKNKITQR